MGGESVSFRITRTTEDLAMTMAAISQRLVKLEQRFAALELQVASATTPAVVDPQELASLEAVELLLADCRELLAEADLEAGAPDSGTPPGADPGWSGQDMPMVA